MILLFDTLTLSMLDGSYFHKFRVVDIEEGKEVVLFKNDSGVGEFPIEGKVLSFDGTTIRFVPLDKIGEGMDKEVTFKVGETTVMKNHYGSFDDPEDLSSHGPEDIQVRCLPVDYMFDCDEYGFIDGYKDYYELDPEGFAKKLPILLEKGNQDLVKKIYKEGLFGVKNDPMKSFSLAIGVEDYNEFLEWANREDVKPDLALMGVYKERELLDFSWQEVYWKARYQKDHGNKDWLPMMTDFVKMVFDNLMFNGTYYSHYLGVRDLVKGVVAENRYDEYDKNMVTYCHSNYIKEEVPLWLLCGLYLQMYANKDNEYKFGAIIEDDAQELAKHVREEYFKNYCHFNREKALALLLDVRFETGAEGSDEARKIFDRYRCDRDD